MALGWTGLTWRSFSIATTAIEPSQELWIDCC